MIEVKNLNFSYGKNLVLDNINFSANEGEILSIIGPNGSGKTTLLKCINKILNPEGDILIDDKDIKKLRQNDIAKIISYVPQDGYNFFPQTVFDTVLLGRKPYINWGVSKEDIEIVSNYLNLMGIKEFALRYFNELSGGERQKVLIARALSTEAKILLLDEPTSNLDIKHQYEIFKIIKKLAEENNIIVISAIHDLNLSARFSDKIIMLKDGKTFTEGKPDSVLTEGNIKNVYGIDTIVKKEEFIYIIPK